jgi:hypothetical protein
MPNHITNIIKANKEVIAALRSDKSAVDFNTMIPMPQSLQEITSNGDDNLVYLLNGKLSINPSDSDILGSMKLSNVLRDLKDGGMTKWDTKRFENFMAMLRNFRDHGFVSWYDFGCSEWGTKWNAYGIIETDENSVQFDTAWSAPHPVIKKLAERFPDVCIEHRWADEDIGSNLGHRRYCNGVSDIPISDAVDFALTVTGNDREYYRANPETGKWEYYEKPETE